MLAARLKVAMRRGRRDVIDGESRDRRTGYYVAGRDWPAISNNISIPAFYDALEEIDDRDVKAAVKSLQVPTPRPETGDN